MRVREKVKRIGKKVIPNYILLRLSPTIISWYSRITTWVYFGRKHEAPIDPLKIIYVCPKNIRHKMATKGYTKFEHSNIISEVLDGNWDNQTKPLNESPTYNGLVNKFENGIPWEETEFYNRNVELIRQGVSKWDCDNLKKFRERLRLIEDIYHNINMHGYKTQRQLRNEQFGIGMRKMHYYLPPELHEITVNIDRKGKMILHDGRHRLTISQILDVNKVPVRIKARHSEWQDIRDQAYIDTDKDHKHHPDIQYKL